MVRAADSTSSNLVEADNASSNADFLHKMGLALREARESEAALIKLRLSELENCQRSREHNLESEAGQLASIFASIILNMKLRLEEERKIGKRRTGN